MLHHIGHDIVRIHNGRSVVIGQNAPRDRIRALMLSGVSESTANVFILGNAHKAAVVQLAQRVGLINC